MTKPRRKAQGVTVRAPSGMHDLDAGQGARSGWHCHECPKGVSTHGGHPHLSPSSQPCKATGYNDIPCTCSQHDGPRLIPGGLQRRAHALTLALESVSCAVLALHRARMCTSGSTSHKATETAHAAVLNLTTIISVEIDKLGAHADFEAKLKLAADILDRTGEDKSFITFEAEALAKLVLK